MPIAAVDGHEYTELIAFNDNIYDDKKYAEHHK